MATQSPGADHGDNEEVHPPLRTEWRNWVDIVAPPLLHHQGHQAGGGGRGNKKQPPGAGPAAAGRLLAGAVVVSWIRRRGPFATTRSRCCVTGVGSVLIRPSIRPSLSEA